MIQLLTPHPVLMVESGERVMLAADLHLGMEYELAKQGINIPYQWNRMLDEMTARLEEYRPDRLILVGDVKHGVPATSFQEKREIPHFFNTLLEAVEHIDVTRGNHDANIQNYLPEEVTLHTSKGVIIGDGFTAAVLHGHAWPPPEMMSVDAVIMAHNHPTVMLNTPLGIRMSQRAWIRGKCEPEALCKAFLAQENVKVEEDALKEFRDHFMVTPGNPEIIIMPMFNDMLGGLPVNQEAPKSLLGPLFRTEAVNMEDFDAYLLDGTYVGKVGFLRKRLESYT
ncbi:MAG: metallophosphoesterase [Candidatus Bathyarchaeota archaeon]|nr:metallophosphoesterase [Candidatus Bathyarchaeota archaeon]